MNKYTVAILGSLLITSASFAAGNSTTPVPYKYGDTLDIAKVVSLSQIPDNTCEVVPATMTYIDSKGVQHTIEYKVLSNGCSYN